MFVPQQACPSKNCFYWIFNFRERLVGLKKATDLGKSLCYLERTVFGPGLLRGRKRVSFLRKLKVFLEGRMSPLCQRPDVLAGLYKFRLLTILSLVKGWGNLDTHRLKFLGICLAVTEKSGRVYISGPSLQVSSPECPSLNVPKRCLPFMCRKFGPKETVITSEEGLQH